MISRRAVFLGAAAAALPDLVFRPSPGAAEEKSAVVPVLPAASPWVAGLGARMRLVRGGPLDDKDAFDAGVQIALDAGFKTYWRMPGEVGVPPAFDWSGSSNLGSVLVNWPAPQRFDEAGLSSIGYTGEGVVLPLRVQAVDPALPVGLSLSLSYAACKSICVPEKADATLVLRRDMPEGLHAAVIEAAGREVPKRIEASTFGLDQPGAVRLSLARNAAALAITPSLGSGEHVLDVFVEGPDNWLFGSPRKGEGAPSGEIGLPLRDHPKAVDRGGEVPFTLTILTDLRAVETMITAHPAS